MVLGLLTSAEGLFLNEVLSDPVNPLRKSTSSGCQTVLAGYLSAGIVELTLWPGQT